MPCDRVVIMKVITSSEQLKNKVKFLQSENELLPEFRRKSTESAFISIPVINGEYPTNFVQSVPFWDFEES